MGYRGGEGGRGGGSHNASLRTSYVFFVAAVGELPRSFDESFQGSETAAVQKAMNSNAKLVRA